MIDLALHQGQGPVTLASISQHQRISLSYLEQLFGKLRRHEIVESVRGPDGGYSLTHRADDATVANIIITVNEPLDATQCGGRDNCGGEERVGGHTDRCITHDLWATLNQKMVEYLDSVSPQNLADQQREHQPEVIRDMREARPARREHTPTRARVVDTPAITSMVTEPVKRTPPVSSVFSLAQSWLRQRGTDHDASPRENIAPPHRANKIRASRNLPSTWTILRRRQ